MGQASDQTKSVFIDPLIYKTRLESSASFIRGSGHSHRHRRRRRHHRHCHCRCAVCEVGWSANLWWLYIYIYMYTRRYMLSVMCFLFGLSYLFILFLYQWCGGLWNFWTGWFFFFFLNTNVGGCWLILWVLICNKEVSVYLSRYDGVPSVLVWAGIELILYCWLSYGEII